MSIITTVPERAASSTIGWTFDRHSSTDMSSPSWVSLSEIAQSRSGVSRIAASASR